MKPTRQILLVEDSANDAALVLAALKQQNLAVEVSVAQDGAEALDFLFRRGEFHTRNQMNPSIVLLDLKMPRVDGFEVLRQIRRDARLNLVPVVIFTSSREENDLAKSYELGANGYVVKPIEYQRLMEAVKMIGSFWAALNEPPPARTPDPNTAGQSIGLAVA